MEKTFKLTALEKSWIGYDIGNSDKYTVKPQAKFGLSNVAATTVNLLGYDAPEMWNESLIETK